MPRRPHPGHSEAGRCIFRADAHVKSGRVILPLIVRRICRYDCGGKQGEIGTGRKEEEPFRSCRGPPRAPVTCLPQTQSSPKHVRLGLLLFIYPASFVHSPPPSTPPPHTHPPLVPLSAVAPTFSFRGPRHPATAPAVSNPPFFWRGAPP